ncbi:lantibiotic dehydratase [Actinomadura oligospora]|uniref:lantibiotic dehydratase n=1 Tax=Actinomadura oligospora TaxID=111804 RepID=UPI00047A5158|nr:lantibiotic dehydratase [Actinomadura oligospora]
MGDKEHSIPLPGTEWTVWEDVILRTTGFPADGLTLFAAPGCAAVADAFLGGRASEDEFTRALDAALADAGRAALKVATDPLFREALTWQNLGAARHLARLAEPEPSPGGGMTGKELRRARHRRRARESAVVRYWQRYCGKNDTIGFFGPVTWGTLDPDADAAVTARPGPGLVRSRQVSYEFWVLEAYVTSLLTDPDVAPWLPAGIHPHLAVRDGHLLQPGKDPVPLDDVEAAVLARCDGVRAAAEIAPDLRQAAVLDRLVEGGIVWQGVNMPYNSRAERVLRETLEAIPEPRARELALAGLDRLDRARDAVAEAAGDADALADALDNLDAEFTDVTGAEPRRRDGQMYAGRRVCFEDTVRDLDISFGRPVLEALSGPFGRVLLPAARWVSAALAEAYDEAFRKLYERLREPGADGVPMPLFWDAVQPLLSGPERPADAVAAEFARRWNDLAGIDAATSGESRLSLDSADLAGRAARLFAADRPGWAAARIHSPDLHIGASSVAALAAGEFTLVLGEMHTAGPTLDSAVFTDRHPDPDKLREAAAADIGPQFRPLYPTWWPQYTARIAPVLGATDHQLAFTAAPGADPGRVLPLVTLTVTDRDGTLEAVGPDGPRRPLREVFSLLFGWLGAEAFKRIGTGAHHPRVTLDRLVVVRETWRTTVGETGIAPKKGAVPEYLAARRLRASLGLPERVFAKVGTEIKPTYVDFTGPRSVSAFASMVRSARDASGDGVPVTFTELLPGPEEAWLEDARGRRYSSELRIQIRDPERPGPPA